MSRTSPFDIVLAFRLLEPAATLQQLADELAVAPSQVHASLLRLEAAGLLRPGTRATNARALSEFTLYGARYAFPVAKGPIVRGIPTAYSAPPLSAEVDATDVVVWPAPMFPGAVQGFAVKPLYRGAPHLVARAPALYELAALLDALRLGDPRIRLVARQRLEQRITAAAATPQPPRDGSNS